jgi:phage terminase large subunit-like protein
MAAKKKTELTDEAVAQRTLAEDSTEEFIKLIHPKRVLGNIHRRTLTWLDSDTTSHKLLLLPRDHMKSTLLAYRVVRALTKDPTLRILLISSTSNLATKQLKFIRDIFTSDRYRLFWPDMVNAEDFKREKWTEREISLDHPLRKEWSIRDPSIFTAGLTTNITGLHCDIAALDDVVVEGNAYTEDGRDKTKDQYSLLSSIETVNAKEWVVGTRYHPLDLYSSLMEMEVQEYNEYGTVVKSEPLFEKIEEQVESVGDGTGEFLWPRQQGPDGKWFGFDKDILARKRAQYLNKLHFRAQYYNDPHDVDSSPIQRSLFQYYDQNHLVCRDGKWLFKGDRLNVFAAVDFAFTLGKKSDYTSVVVVGVDGKNNYYVLEIDRFKTDRISDYFEHILKLYTKWGFRKIRAEVSAAQSAIVKDLRESYVRPHGLSLAIDEFRPSRIHGAKEERIMACLEPKYANRQMWHYQGGNTQSLEEELIFANPSHDDIKDALSMAVDFAIPPIDYYKLKKDQSHAFQFHSRWGGVA